MDKAMINKNHKIWFFLVGMGLIISSCVSVKNNATAAEPTGDWQYLIAGTPNGNYEGILSIQQAGAGYKGTLSSAEGTIPFTVLSFDPSTKTIRGEFPYSDMTVILAALVSENELTGNVVAGNYEFPFHATRK